jgi:uncharacterized protein YbaP (TraB family)
VIAERRIEFGGDEWLLLAGGKVHLIAVGALHLVGTQGLVEMLRARGYTVTEL